MSMNQENANHQPRKRKGGALMTVLLVLVCAIAGVAGGLFIANYMGDKTVAPTTPTIATGGNVQFGQGTGRGNAQLTTGSGPVMFTSDATIDATTDTVTTIAVPPTGARQRVGSATTALSTSGVSGDGKLTAQDGVDVLTPAAVTIIQLPAKAGDEVVRGEVLARVDKDKLSTTLSDLRAQQTSQESAVKSLSGAKASSTIYSPVSGRIKKTFAEKGQDVRSVIDKNGALMVVSTDGLMKVTFVPDSMSGLRPGAEVDVKNDKGDTWTGRVASISDASSEVTVTFSDKGPDIDEEVTVYLGGIIGSGAAQVNAPLAITATGGIISTIPKTENTKIDKGASLFTLTNVPISDDYNTALTKRQDIIDQISSVTAMMDTGEICAPESGIVNVVYDGITNKPLGKDTAILSLSSNEKLDLVISVDEMDVVKLKIGQSATATIPAIDNQTFAGSVKKIASVGKIVGGIAMYDVTLSIENAPGMRVAMSGSATIE